MNATPNLWRKPVQLNIPGTGDRLSVGDRVSVTDVVYDGSKPSMRDSHGQFRPREGTIVGAITNDCGATVDDPMWVVELPWTTDGFWTEELRRL